MPTGMTICIKQERRKALRQAMYGCKPPQECHVLLCAPGNKTPVFVVEYSDGTCECVPVTQIQFVKEDDE